jgi:N-methylhydantoinase B
VLSQLTSDGYKIYLEILGGGYGASAHGDGCDAVDSPLSNCSNVPVEAMDMEYDYFRVEDYSLVADSGGAGKYRGGLGFQRRYHILADNVTFATYSDRFRLAPEGLFGGADGVCASTQVLRGDQVIELPSKVSYPLQKGDILVARTGGGAGYGNVDERLEADVARDLAEGFICRAEAAE